MINNVHSVHFTVIVMKDKNITSKKKEILLILRVFLPPR